MPKPALHRPPNRDRPQSPPFKRFAGFGAVDGFGVAPPFGDPFGRPGRPWGRDMVMTAVPDPARGGGRLVRDHVPRTEPDATVRANANGFDELVFALTFVTQHAEPPLKWRSATHRHRALGVWAWLPSPRPTLPGGFARGGGSLAPLLRRGARGFEPPPASRSRGRHGSPPPMKGTGLPPARASLPHPRSWMAPTPMDDPGLPDRPCSGAAPFP